MLTQGGDRFLGCQSWRWRHRKRQGLQRVGMEVHGAHVIDQRVDMRQMAVTRQYKVAVEHGLTLVKRLHFRPHDPGQGVVDVALHEEEGQRRQQQRADHHDGQSPARHELAASGGRASGGMGAVRLSRNATMSATSESVSARPT